MIDSLKIRYPNAYKNFQLIKNGSSRFFRETFALGKTKLYLSKDANHIHRMTWKEMEIYRNLPKDWKKVFPVILISSLPFLNYIVLPLAFLYPEKLLCRHFWSKSQTFEYGERALIKKLPLNKIVLNDLLVQSDRFLDDQVAKNVLIDTVKKVQNGSILSNKDIVELGPILNRPVFVLNKLSNDHLQNLAKLNNCSRFFNLNPLKSLKHYAFWLTEFDKLLKRENLTAIEKRYIIDFCFERGINASKMPIEQAIKHVKARLELTELLANTTDHMTKFCVVMSSYKHQTSYKKSMKQSLVIAKNCNQKRIFRLALDGLEPKINRYSFVC